MPLAHGYLIELKYLKRDEDVSEAKYRLEARCTNA